MSVVRSCIRGACGLATVLTLAIAPSLPAADESRPVAFRIDAGTAETTLRAFTEQAGVQVIYPAQLVENVHTQAVYGTFTARAALDQMLTGTKLSTWQDEQTGALAIGRAPKAPAPILLPPYVLEETTSEFRWRYARAQGIEVLSRCSDEVTVELISQNYGLHELIELLVPKNLQAHMTRPTPYLFFSEGGLTPAVREILAAMQQREVEVEVTQSGKGGKPVVQISLGVLPNYRFWDQDSLAIFFVWEEISGNRGQMMITPGYVRYLLEHRIPALPAWFIEGTMELYRTVVMHTAPIRSLGSAFATPESGTANGVFASPFSDHPEKYSISVHAANWVSAETTLYLRKHPRARADLMPLETLFGENPPTDMESADGRLWRSEAALFIRWMIEDNREPRRQALWKWVERGSTGPVTEAMFRECFGVSYQNAQDELSDYLRIAINTSLTLHPKKTPELIPVELRQATDAEVSRIKGDFNRLEIAYVQQVSPELTGKYVEQARRTLRKSYDVGDRDPRLLAQLGLCECDAGNDGGALPYLEAATQAKVVRPRAYYELARIRYAAVRPLDPDGKLTTAQLATVLQPLYAMRGQTPPLGEAYELMAEAWLRSSAHPAATQLSILDEGVRLFPRRPRLLLSVALIQAGEGNLGAAEALIEQGLSVTTHELDRARFVRLQTMIAARRDGHPTRVR